MDYIEILKRLISIDTTVPPGKNYEQAAGFLCPFFDDAGFDTCKVQIPPEAAGGRQGRWACVGHRRFSGKPRLVIYGHFDVVPAEGWDAFDPRVDGGRVYGRGAADMKGAIVALIMAINRLEDRELRFDTSVMLTSDEEFDQAGQLLYLKDYLNLQKGVSFLNLDADFGFVSIANLGALQMDIKVKGKSVHSALSNLGENAVEKSGLLMNALMELKAGLAGKRSAVPTHPSTGLAFMEPRLNINMIKGGLKVNIVPDECVISVDRRLIPEENLDDARQELFTTLSAVPDVNWELERVFAIPTVPPCDDPLTDELAEIVKDVTGQGGKYGSMGSGDLPHIVRGWGGQTFGLGVIRPECNIHGRNEFVYRQDIEDLAEVLVRFLAC